MSKQSDTLNFYFKLISESISIRYTVSMKGTCGKAAVAVKTLKC